MVYYYRFSILFYLVFLPPAAFSVDLPSDEVFEKEILLPLQKKKEKQNQEHFDFYEPKTKAESEELKLYLLEIERWKLFENAHWIRLLRYRKSILSGFESEIVSDGYFLSEKGKVDPRKELLASIRGLFFEKKENTDLSPACVFPERYRWLRQILKIDPANHKIVCHRFETWKQNINLSKVKLVFASYYLQSPASMFGHTFLKLNNKLNLNSEMLDYGIGYAAEPGEIDPVRYVIGGIFGGYTGKFSIFPYYAKINEYNDLENRDLWEYELELDDLQKEILLGHLWEMGQANFDYYFYRENCAYQTLRVLEVVKDIDLQSGKQMVLTPLDLLKRVHGSGLVNSRSTAFRPSLYHRIENEIKELKDEEKELYFQNLGEIDQSQEITLNKDSEARLVPLLLDTFQYRLSQRKLQETDDRYFRLLGKQSTLPVKDSKAGEIKKGDFPESAHGAQRLSLGYGNASIGNFMEVESRVAYHDLLNVPKGLISTSEIQFFNLKVRMYEGHRPEITTFNLIKLASLSPYNRLSQKHSYFIDIGTQTLSSKHPETRKAVGNLDLLYGYSFAREFSNGNPLGVFSLLGGLKAQTNSDFAYGMRYGPQVMIHYLYEWERFKFQWQYSYSYTAMSKNDNFFQNTLRLRYAIHVDHEIRFEYTTYPQYAETLVSYQYLF